MKQKGSKSILKHEENNKKGELENLKKKKGRVRKR